MKSQRSGAVLLEVLCALVVLSSAGVALVSVVASGMHAVARASTMEELREEQSRILVAHSLMTRHELAERLGLRAVAGLVVEVIPVRRSLFRVTVSGRQMAASTPLTSVLYAVD
ncbi:MAG: hypothetical protein ACT4P6_11075 [Gemmatimonadaceae bacterium]